MAKKKVAAVVKIQIPAGKATPAPPVGTALGPHGVAIMDFCKQYNAATESPDRHDRARRDHGVRGPHVHLHPQDAADAGAAAPGGRPREGLDDAGQGHRRHDHRGPGRGDRQDQDARPQRLRPRGGQAAGPRHRPLHGHHRQSDDPIPTSSTNPHRDDLARAARPHEGASHGERQEVHRRGEALRPRPAVHARPRPSTW